MICKSCNEIRPSFHATLVSASFKGNDKPHEIPQWTVCGDGRCKRCFDEIKSELKKF